MSNDSIFKIWINLATQICCLISILFLWNPWYIFMFYDKQIIIIKVILSVFFFLWCSLHSYFTYNSASHLLYLNSNSVMNIAQPFYPKWLWPFDILYMQRTSSNNLKHCFILSTALVLFSFSLHNDRVWVAYWIKWWKWNKSIYISRQTSESFRIGWTLSG